jgi:hypothetical protein
MKLGTEYFFIGFTRFPERPTNSILEMLLRSVFFASLIFHVYSFSPSSCLHSPSSCVQFSLSPSSSLRPTPNKENAISLLHQDQILNLIPAFAFQQLNASSVNEQTTTTTTFVQTERGITATILSPTLSTTNSFLRLEPCFESSPNHPLCHTLTRVDTSTWTEREPFHSHHHNVEPKPLSSSFLPKITSSKGGDFLCAFGKLSLDRQFCCSRKCKKECSTKCVKKGPCCFSSPAPIRSCLNSPAPCSMRSITRVAVSYTKSVMEETADIDGLIDLAFAETNQGLINSRIPITVLRVHPLMNVSEVHDQEEEGNMMLLFEASLQKNTGNQVAADMHVLLYRKGAYCGAAKELNCVNQPCFALVNSKCATGYYSFGHELGHLFGVRVLCCCCFLQCSLIVYRRLTTPQ